MDQVVGQALSAFKRMPVMPSLAAAPPRGDDGAVDMTGLQLWAGPEASRTHVGRRVVDQLESTGFARSPDNLDRLAALGASHVRLPVLRERTGIATGACDFRGADQRLPRLRELGIERGLCPPGGAALSLSHPLDTGQ